MRAWLGGTERRRPRRGDGAPGTAALLVLAGLAGCSAVGGPLEELRDPEAPPRTLTPELVARRVIDARSMGRDVRTLSSGDLRHPDVAGGVRLRAASWVAERFQLAGLEPAGEGGGYVRYRTLPGDTVPIPDVVGLRPGADLALADQPIVVTATLGHPPAREAADTSGANPASMVALVTVAEAFSALPERPRRPLLFLVAGDDGGGADVAAGAVGFAGAAAVVHVDAPGAGEEADGQAAAAGDRDPEALARFARRLFLDLERLANAPPIPAAHVVQSGGAP